MNKKIEEIEREAQSEKFWEKEENFKKLEELEKLKNIKDKIEKVFDFLKNEDYKNAKDILKDLYYNFCLKNDYKNSKVIMNIYVGAGGKDAEDWVGILTKMYKNFFEKNKIRYNILDSDENEYGGYKFISFEIENGYYPILKFEKGVHRLVRISPFSKKRLRHTSFAYVEVLPLIEDPKIEINDKDLEIQTFRASAKGGQNVNKVETAVRIRYKPLNIVVTCQSERYQHKNKEKALQILKSRILNYMEDQKTKKIEELKGRVEISWGYQKRSYIIDPYKLVKDHQFNYETRNLDEVLNGGLKLIHPLGAIL
ncbi:MAG: peptide chain release factor-like protein [Minisyncoccia bacterium]